ncbi:mitochondrial import inner membrane translocase subunit tim16 [Sphaerosporella brunnea]|uniref:Mitochondrial import inner membrane translocase subunit TIM16 n=1 Tax=Sphaerosporella brunnea TaxID=1250544 RepID=A0A5J5EZ16_9PEZI|nr:mitochondrial import inner membrane translocase subunit tim16 [Sphaerosporella brunnea]
MAHRIIAQIVLVGSRVVGRAFVEAYKQAQASAKYQKAAAAAGTSGVILNGRGGVTLDEAYKILNLKPEGGAAVPSAEAIAERYKTLFERNDPKKGGSFYLQSKVYRARERLEAEAKKAADKAKQQQQQQTAS